MKAVALEDRSEIEQLNEDLSRLRARLSSKDEVVDGQSSEIILLKTR